MDDMLAAGLLEELRDFHRRYNREKVAENRWVRSQLPFCSHSHLPGPCRARINSACSTSNVSLLPALSWQHLLLQQGQQMGWVPPLQGHHQRRGLKQPDPPALPGLPCQNP